MKGKLGVVRVPATQETETRNSSPGWATDTPILKKEKILNIQPSITWLALLRTTWFTLMRQSLQFRWRDTAGPQAACRLPCQSTLCQPPLTYKPHSAAGGSRPGAQWCFSGHFLLETGQARDSSFLGKCTSCAWKNEEGISLADPRACHWAWTEAAMFHLIASHFFSRARSSFPSRLRKALCAISLAGTCIFIER